MSPTGAKRALFAGLIVLAIVRHDLWWWYDPTPIFKIPIGLVYHAAFCLAVSVTMALLVKYAWPLPAETVRVSSADVRPER